MPQQKRKQQPSSAGAASASTSAAKPAIVDVANVDVGEGEPEAKRAKIGPADAPAPALAPEPQPADTTSTTTTTPTTSGDQVTPSSTHQSSVPPKSSGGGGKRGGRGGKRGANDRRKNNNSNKKNDDWSTPRAPRNPEGGEGEGAAEGEKEKRLPKRKVAVLVGYRGTGYSGSQINPGVKTIENDVFQAFVKAGCVSADNAADPSKVAFQRSARTDAGVHAVGNVLALKLILNPVSLTSTLPPTDPPTEPTIASLIAHINSFLPSQIRIWSIIRVQTSFNARDYCDSRRYEYSLPSYALLPPKPGTPMSYRMKGEPVPQRSAASGAEGTGEKDGDAGEGPSADPRLAAEAVETSDEGLPLRDEEYVNCPPGEFWDRVGLERNLATEVALKRRWRADEQSLEALRGMLRMFHGSHNFHNFTVGKDFRDRSAQRVIKAIEVLEPFTVNGYQWISIRVHGQSFMLHQIRKMVGFAILAVRIRCPSSLLPEMFGPSRLHVPKAPARGLLLESPIFEGYNRKISAGQNPNTETRDPILFHDFVTTDEEAKRFRSEMIYKTMWGDEEKDAGFAVWLQYLDHHRSDDFGYFNPAGTIPESAYAPRASALSAAKDASGGLDEDDEDEVKVGNDKQGGMYMEG